MITSQSSRSDRSIGDRPNLISSLEISVSCPGAPANTLTLSGAIASHVICAAGKLFLAILRRRGGDGSTASVRFSSRGARQTRV
jgi:hypothetical protein